MAADVIDFSKKKLEASPHCAGDMFCVACRHEWVGVHPVGLRWVECPKCGLHHGHTAVPKLPDARWVCNCGCDLFTLSSTGNAICALCGAYPSDWP